MIAEDKTNLDLDPYSSIRFANVKKNPNLTAEQKVILFEEGTEPPGSSELNNEKREGTYHCANCDVKLFELKEI